MGDDLLSMFLNADNRGNMSSHSFYDEDLPKPQ